MKKNSIWKIIGLLLVTILALAVVFMLMPFVAIAGAFGFWYFSKKNPNERYRMFSLVALGIGIIGSFFSIPAFINSVQNNSAQNIKLKTPSPSDFSEEKSSTQQSSQEESKSSSSSNSSSVQTEVNKKDSTDDDSLPRITTEQMPDFIEYLKQDLADKGVDITTYTFYNKDTRLYVTVPNEYKTYSKTDLKSFGDGLKEKEHEAFNVWSAINGVDFNSYPMLFIKTDDGDSLVSQKINGDMEVKVK